MRWKIGRKQSASPNWTARLDALGQAVDATGLGLRDLAVSFMGAEIWVCAGVWRAGRFHSGWATIALRMDGPVLVPIGRSTAVPWHRVGGFAAVRYQPHLLSLGVHLDRKGRRLQDPWIVETSGGFIVTALTVDVAVPGGWIPISYEFTAVDLADAGATGRGRR